MIDFLKIKGWYNSDLVFKTKNLLNKLYTDNIYEYDGYPVIDYAYEVKIGKITDDQVLRVWDEAKCIIIFNPENETYYISPAFGNMESSKNIALAYMILYAEGDKKYGEIDYEFIDYVSIDHSTDDDIMNNNKYLLVMETLKDQLDFKNKEYVKKIADIRSNITFLK